MKLNIGCGRDVKPGFVNIDAYERENKLDLVIDVTKEFPFKRETVDYIYAEQFIEHLTWLDGKNFLYNCYFCLKEGGMLRLVLPDYETIFRKYLEKDTEYFKPFFEGMSEDFEYYSEVYHNTDRVARARAQNPPPAWHLSDRPSDRKRLALRVRTYKYPIEIVHWFTHQYGEHLTLYDFEMLEGIMKEIGFKEVKKVDIQRGLDSEAPTRITSSLYVEGVK